MEVPKLNFGSLAARGGDDEDDPGAPRRSTEEDDDVDMTGFSAQLKKTAAAGKGEDDDPATSSAGESNSDEYEDYDARAAAADALARASASSTGPALIPKLNVGATASSSDGGSGGAAGAAGSAPQSSSSGSGVPLAIPKLSFAASESPDVDMADATTAAGPAAGDAARGGGITSVPKLNFASLSRGDVDETLAAPRRGEPDDGDDDDADMTAGSGAAGGGAAAAAAVPKLNFANLPRSGADETLAAPRRGEADTNVMAGSGAAGGGGGGGAAAVAAAAVPKLNFANLPRSGADETLAAPRRGEADTYITAGSGAAGGGGGGSSSSSSSSSGGGATAAAAAAAVAVPKLNFSSLPRGDGADTLAAPRRGGPDDDGAAGATGGIGSSSSSSSSSSATAVEDEAAHVDDVTLDIGIAGSDDEDEDAAMGGERKARDRVNSEHKGESSPKTTPDNSPTLGTRSLGLPPPAPTLGLTVSAPAATSGGSAGINNNNNNNNNNFVGVPALEGLKELPSSTKSSAGGSDGGGAGGGEEKTATTDGDGESKAAATGSSSDRPKAKMLRAASAQPLASTVPDDVAVPIQQAKQRGHGQRDPNNSHHRDHTYRTVMKPPNPVHSLLLKYPAPPMFHNVRSAALRIISDVSVAETFMCQICMTRYPKEETYAVKACKHRFCTDCITMYLSLKVKEAKTCILCPWRGEDDEAEGKGGEGEAKNNNGGGGQRNDGLSSPPSPDPLELALFNSLSGSAPLETSHLRLAMANSNDRTGPADDPAAAEDNETWQCATCTLINATEELTCAACGELNPGAIDGLQNGDDDDAATAGPGPGPAAPPPAAAAAEPAAPREVQCAAEMGEADITALCPDLLTKYQRFVRMKNDPHTRDCPKCGHMQAGDPDPKRRRMVCEKCTYVYCYEHGGAHEGTTCKVYVVVVIVAATTSRRACVWWMMW
eukprot:g3901.t1